MGEGTSSTRFTAGLSGDARVVGEMKAFSGAFCDFCEVWGAREHAGEGEIEVERWPVQAATATDDLEIALGGRRGGVEKRVQPERENESAAVGDLDDEHARAADGADGGGGDAG
jgi:hypothetical protein